jgi:hypothetical protein
LLGRLCAWGGESGSRIIRKAGGLDACLLVLTARRSRQDSRNRSAAAVGDGSKNYNLAFSSMLNLSAAISAANPITQP